MKIKKVVLAYSGGLDTSVILKWLKETYRCEVIAYSANIGQEEELDGLEAKAIKTGASKCYIEDLTEDFVKNYIFQAIKANAIYEDRYLLGTSLARPVIAKKQVEIARLEGADALCHGATGKGNDQVRFEMAFKALAPDLKIIAPWREWELDSRSKLFDYAEKHGIALPVTKDKPYSMDRNILHISYEGGILEDPYREPDEDMFILTKSPEAAPDKPTYIEIEFKKGEPVAINGKKMKPVALMKTLNKIAGENGIGRIDIVENRLVGIKSRGVYETPAGTVLMTAHRDLESITLDRDTQHFKDNLANEYARLIYNGLWFTRKREALDALINKTQEYVSGVVKLKLYKGNCIVVGRKSDYTLYEPDIATFDASALYDQKDATGFLNLYGLPIKVEATLRKDKK
ncbi:MAG TPA: argininosuccinate synthase [Spirochaetota bacterium]|jgi:argininosuccinate synthase|nr:argininosuccinate synthase [Spirochaetota bacterium]OQA98457.1 MAG: Argininosuccinate synthase [Spirochaetes bacterium ADurb.Bin218]HOK01501.1 argininosuccinate synthase [Spirochaetota bacterium]HOQ11126.1 argininosuccinate synthase [Spirochaetota bacterium]HOV08485.1 argininosuccinate synthase [Spirochaetota bacterium]